MVASRCTATALLAALTLSLPAVVAAQGQGRPKGPKSPSAPPTTTTAPSIASGTSTAGTSGPAPSATMITTPTTGTTTTGVRQFGSWLDDASAPTRGDVFASISAGQWHLAGLTQTNLPMLAVAAGVTDRVQVGASVPFYRLQAGGTTVSGVDDLYVHAKVSLIDPTLTVREFGLAVSPVLEVLSGDTPGGRVHMAIPVNVEWRRLPVRVYGSAGWFTRGSIFSAAAVEWSSPVGMSVTGGLTQSRSVASDATLDQLGVGRQRADLFGSVAQAIGSRATVSASVGRTLTSIEDGGTRFSISGGVTLRFSVPLRQPTPHQPAPVSVRR